MRPGRGRETVLGQALARTHHDNALFKGDIDACFRQRSLEAHRHRLACIRSTIDTGSGLRILKPGSSAGRREGKSTLGSKIVGLICSVVKPVFVDFDGEGWVLNILEKDVEIGSENENDSSVGLFSDREYDSGSIDEQDLEDVHVYNQKEEEEEKEKEEKENINQKGNTQSFANHTKLKIDDLNTQKTQTIHKKAISLDDYDLLPVDNPDYVRFALKEIVDLR